MNILVWEERERLGGEGGIYIRKRTRRLGDGLLEGHGSRGWDDNHCRWMSASPIRGSSRSL